MAETDDKNRVLATATTLFNERGVQAVGMDAIRDAAGISLKRLYSCFRSKADLVAAVLEQRDADVRRAMTEYAQSRAADPRDRILAVFDFLAHWFAESDFRGCMFINTIGELGGTSTDVRRIARLHKTAVRDYLADLVAAAELPSELADQLAILADGAIVAATIWGDGTDAAGAARRAAATLISAS